MGVNSALKGFFNNRLRVGSGIAILMLAIFFIASSFKKDSDHDLRARQVNLLIRQMGHLLLLQSGDSISRVLPVTEIKEGTFLLEFENEFVFNHDSLVALSERLLPRTQFPSGYTVTVHDCMTASIIYGFQINNTSPDILACRGRRQPSGCYTIEIAFTDFYENVERNKEEDKKADIDLLTDEVKSIKVDPQEVNPISIDTGTDEFKTITTDYDNDQLAEVKSFEVGTRESDPIPVPIGTEEFKTKIFWYPLITLVYYGGILVLFGVTLLIARFKRSLVPVPLQNQDHTIMKEAVPELAALGKFSFDVKGQRLLVENEVISLTDKECRILELLHKNFGELIPRETLMQKVWISEGVITGRSLDMFVSKLRKKLSRDPELRITNVHGKGYKLEIADVINNE